MNEMVEILRGKVDEAKFLDVGEGAAKTAGVSIMKLRTALAALRNEGYHVYKVPTKQKGTDVVTFVRVLTTPDASYKNTHDALKQTSISSL